MNKKKWIVGLSIAGVMALSGTAFALSSGSVVAQAVGQTPGSSKSIETTAQSSQPGTPQATILTPTSPNSNLNVGATPGSNGNGGGYGMMGGQGANGNGGYGMVGGQGANGSGGGHGMMGGGYNAQSLGIDLTNGEVTTSDQATAIAKAYKIKLNQDLVVGELHEFSNGYEVELKEAKTGAAVYEVMVYKKGGQVIAEMVRI